MLKSFLIRVFLLSFLHQTYTGRIWPYGANYITMSTTNANDVSEFNFTMTTDNPIPDNGAIDIVFPAGQFQTGLGLPNDIIVYDPYPKIITSSVSDRTITCNTGAKPSNIPFTITVLNIINPLKVGGTGNFKIKSKINDYIIDENYVFGVVGISGSPNKFISASIEIESGQSVHAGDLTNYIVSFATNDDIQSNIIIRIVFPEIYNLNYILQDQCEALLYDSYKLSGNFICKVNQNFQNMLDFIGNSAVITKGRTFKLRIKEIANPSVSMTTDLFTFRILDKGSNNTLQIQDSVAGLKIFAGLMSNVALTGYYPIYLPFLGYTRKFKLSFKPKNPFNAMRIATQFPTISRCYLSKGLLDLTLVSNILCTFQSNIMFISNFQQYARSDFANDYVELTFEAEIPSSLFKTKPLEIYTYSDDTFLTIVDQDIASDSTTVMMMSSPTNAASASIVLSPVSTTPNAQITFLVTLKLGTNYLKPNTVQLEIPSDYIGTSICQCSKYIIQLFVKFFII